MKPLCRSSYELKATVVEARLKDYPRFTFGQVVFRVETWWP